MNEEQEIKNDTTGFWSGLGIGLLLFLFCSGVGTCSLLERSRFTIEKKVETQNVEKAVDESK